MAAERIGANNLLYFGRQTVKPGAQIDWPAGEKHFCSRRQSDHPGPRGADCTRRSAFSLMPLSTRTEPRPADQSRSSRRARPRSGRCPAAILYSLRVPAAKLLIARQGLLSRLARGNLSWRLLKTGQPAVISFTVSAISSTAAAKSSPAGARSDLRSPPPGGSVSTEFRPAK